MTRQPEIHVAKQTRVRHTPRGVTGRARKNMDMDVAKLEAAGRILGTRTDTETVDQALDLVTFHGEVFSALDRLAAAGGLADAFGQAERAPARRRRGGTRS